MLTPAAELQRDEVSLSAQRLSVGRIPSRVTGLMTETPFLQSLRHVVDYTSVLVVFFFFFLLSLLF